MNSSRRRAAAIIVISLALFIAEFAAYSLSTDPGTENLRYISHHYDMSYRVWLTSKYYPPFWDYFWHLFILLFGPLYTYSSVANALFVVLGAVLVYLLLRRERVGPDFAAAGFAMTLLAPAALSAAVRMRVESMMWFLLVGFIYFLARSRTFTRLKDSALSAVCASLGLLGKWSFAGYIALPALVESLTPSKRPARKLWGLAAFGLTALILCGPWYLGVMEPDRILPSATNDPSLPVYSFLGMVKLNLSVLAADLWGRLLSGLSLTLVILALVFSRSKTLWLLTSSAVGAVVFFSIPSHTEERYLWPLVPVFAAATALAAGRLHERFKRVHIAPTLLLCLALLNAGISWALVCREHGYRYQDILLRTMSLPDGTHARFHEFFKRAVELAGKEHPHIGIFPPLEFEFIDWGYSEYLRRISSELAPYRVSTFDFTVYWMYQEDLRAMKFDAIVMDCSIEGDCDRTFEVYLETERDRLRRPYYQVGMKEDEVKIFDPESFIEDFELIKKRYKPAALCECYPEYVFVMWVRKNLSQN